MVFASDLSMLKNEWGFTQYPFVPGHEVIGIVTAIGNMVNHLKVGQYVGIGWRARSCLVCDQCLSGLDFLIHLRRLATWVSPKAR